MGDVVRILVADDHPLTRDGIKAALALDDDLEVVAEASDGQEAVDLAEEVRPDVVLMDVRMPVLGGIRATQAISRTVPSARVVMLTVEETQARVGEAIQAGAAGYLLKSEPPERIVGFLRGVANGEAALSGEVARRLLDQLRSGGRINGGVPDEIATALSAREVEVLLLLDEHLSTDDIAKRLFISEHTVRSHVKSLLRKLGVSSRRDALEQLALARR